MLLAYMFLAFILLKIVFLNGFLWFASGRFPFSARILCAYIFGVVYVVSFVISRIFGFRPLWMRSFLSRYFGDVKIVNTLLNVSKA